MATEEFYFEQFQEEVITKLNSMTDSEVLNDYINELENTKKMTISKHPIEKSYSYKEEHIMPQVKIDKKNNGLSYPYLDEREETRYKKKVHSRGFLQHVYAKTKFFPFGMMEITFIFDQLTPRGDSKFYNSHRVLSKKEIWINSEEKGRHDRVQDPKNDEILAQIQEKIYQYFRRIDKMADEYSEKTDNFFKLKSKGTIQGMREYLKAITDYLKKDLEIQLKIHRAYDNITTEEMDVILIESKGVLNRISGLLAALDQAQEYYKWKDDKNIVEESSSVPPVKEIYDLFKKLNISQFISQRDSDKLIGKDIEYKNHGYILIDEESETFYPNLREIENRVQRFAKGFSEDDEKMVQKHYLELYQKLLKNKTP